MRILSFLFGTFELFFLAVLSACQSNSVSPQAAGTGATASPNPVAAAIQTACQRRVDAGLFQGVAVGLTAKSTADVDVFCGSASDEHERYELGSISKSFAGIELSRQVLAGKIDLAAPLSKYIAELAGSYMGTVTAVQLATHTARLIRDLPGDPRMYGENELLAFLKNYEPDSSKFPVGSRTYSNLGFGTLGFLLTRVTGDSFTNLIQNDILNPLQMKETGFLDSMAAPPALLRGFDVLLQPANYFPLSDIALAWGGVVSDLHDMMIFLDANLRPGLSDLSLDMMLSQARGLGWDSLPGDRKIWKDGAMSAGFSTIIEFNPDSGNGVIVLGNEFSGPSISTLGGVGMGTADTSVMNALDPGFLNQVIGTYSTADSSLLIEVLSVHDSYLGIHFKTASASSPSSSSSSSPSSARLLSMAGTSVRFSVDNGSSSLDRIEFAPASSSQPTSLNYLEPNGTDSSGQTIYHTTLFVKE